MIATMALNQPDDDEEDRTTLVIVPAALMQQWKEEITTKTNDMFRVHVHHGKDKLKKVEQLKKKDVRPPSILRSVASHASPGCYHYVPDSLHGFCNTRQRRGR